MREPVPLEVVIEVRVRIEMEDAQIRVAFRIGAENGIGDRMVATQRDDAPVLVELRSDGLLDPLKHRRPRQVAGEIPEIEQVEFVVFQPIFTRLIRGWRADRLTDHRRRLGGSTNVG